MRLAALSLCLVACAAEGGEDGGSDNLPDRGVSGWERTATDPAHPFVLTDPAAMLAGPSAIVVAGRVLLYGHLERDGAAELFRADGDATGETLGAPVALGLSGRDPSVAFDQGTFWLAWVDPSGAIALARSSDGLAFESLAVTGLAAERSAPSLVLDGARVRLYLSTGTTIVLTEADRDGLAFGPEREVFAPGTECSDPSGKPEPCWDEGAIVEAEVRLAKTGAGANVYRMFYAGRAAGDSDLGFAASLDGLAFERFPFNPVLTGSFDEKSPTEIIADGRYLLYWHEAHGSGGAGILEAVHDPSAPSDRW